MIMHRSPAAAERGSELKQALSEWKRHCLDGASAVAVHDIEALERSLAARDTLQPRIEALVAHLESSGGPSESLFAAVKGMLHEASVADEHLVSLLTAERTRLRRDIDGAGRMNAPAQAYGRPDAPVPHRLDIRR